MKNTFILLFSLFNILALSCASKSIKDENDFTSEEKKSTNTIIKGKIEGKAARSVYIQELTKTRFVMIDSTKVDEKGNFTISISTLTEPTLCFVTFDAPRPPGFPIVLGNGTKLKLEINNSDWISYKPTGDKHTLKINELYNIYINHDKALQTLNNEVSLIDPIKITDSLRQAVSNQFKNMQIKRNEDISNFVKSNEGSPASYYASTFLFEEINLSLMQVAYEKLNQSMPESKYTKDLKSNIDAIAPLEVGGIAPDIIMKNMDGVEMKMSSLRGKIVLIDFWASWCGPCRKENPNVVKLYNQYKDKGFEILGVSLDDNPDKWKAAVLHDGLTWKHVSDLKGWQNSAAQTYQVSSIPFTVLLDKNGRIIAKGLRGSDLEFKLAELLK
jgi:thiol-disulfide isomerase/thioredoxin